jgi:hypothetical protein
MGKIGHGYGSEWHLLRHLGYHRQYLNAKILNITGGEVIEWLDFRFTHQNKPLAHDHELEGIEFVPSPAVQQQWRGYWPQTGSPPNWDAVGKLKHGQDEAWLLVEAKAYGGELKSTCSAGAASREIIKQALAQTRDFYHITAGAVEDWLTPYYQYCNRLAVLHFLWNICQPAVPAHLVFIYFYGDTVINTQSPQQAAAWQPILDNMYAAIGLDKQNKIRAHVHNIFLPVNPQHHKHLLINQ